MGTKDLNNLSKEELVQKKFSLSEELAKLNQQRYDGRVDKPHRFKLVKKDIARINTILRQKEEKSNG